MKKILLLSLVFLTSILSACSSMDEGNEPQIIFDESITYNYDTGSFNNTYPEDLLYGINDYKLEFYQVYKMARNEKIITEDLTVSEITAFDLFFQKLEILDKHDSNIFILDSNEIKELFEANNIEIKAIDIFTFNSIKSIFDTIKSQSYSIPKVQFLEVVLDRSLTNIEVSAIQDIYVLQNMIYNDYFGEISFNLTFDDYMTEVEKITGNTIDETDRNTYETAYNLLHSIK